MSEVAKAWLLSSNDRNRHPLTLSIDPAGSIRHVLVDTKKPIGTYFKAKKRKNSRFKHWLKYCALPQGTLIIDDGAVKALLKRKSLLSVGIQDISDGVDAKDTVYIVNKHNQPIGTGKIDYNSQEIKNAISKKKKLGVVIHSDNLSLN